MSTESPTKERKATLVEILRAFWRGMRPQIWAFYLIFVAFIGASLARVVTPIFYKKFFDLIASNMAKAAAAPSLIQILLTVLFLNAIGWILFRVGLFLLNRFEVGVMARLREISFDYLINHSYGFFINNFTGALVQRLNRFSRAFEKLYDTLVFNILPLAVSITGAMIVIWLQAPLIAVAMFVWIVLTIVGNYIFYAWKLKYDLRASEMDSATTARLSDAITNQTTIASFTGVEYESTSFKEISDEQARATRLSWDLSAISDAVQAGLVVAVEFFLFYYGVKFWEQGVITIGTFVLIQAYLLGLVQQLWGSSRIIRLIYEALADSEEMVSILNLAHDVKDMPGAKPLVVTNGEIVFENVSFQFGEQPSVLKNIDLKIAGGEKIAVIGPSGAGKSTLVRLILRLYNLHDGKIFVDSQDIQHVTQRSLRENISLVPQDPVLFHRTLLENIRYGRRNATDAEVIAAAKLAHCDEFIDALLLKYETLVGERGIKLSGGERQRVAIARAILKNAPILILDEATSSLDSHSEALIQDALDKLMKGKTTIVVAHRLSTIRKMDRIIVIQGGEIVEEGTHHALIGREKSLYKHLWTLQAGGFLTV